ncbi:MAG: hypothetical protein V1928_04955 [Parcubacteria group bacterium]
MKKLTLFGIVFLALALTAIIAFLPASAEEDVTAPALVDFSYEPIAVDTTAGDQSITVTFRFTDAVSGVRSAMVHFISPSGGQYVYGGAVRISGNEYDGIYQATVTFKRYCESGVWQVHYVYADDIAGNYRYVYAGELASEGYETNLAVTSEQDISSPALVDFHFEPTAIDTSESGQTVTVTLQASDGLTGVRAGSGVMVHFRSPSRMQYVYGSCRLIDGTVNDGIFECQIPFEQNCEEGIWTVDYVYLADLIDNYVYYRASDLASLGFPAELEVASVQDVTTPALIDFDFAPTCVDVSASDQVVTATIRATDDMSGVRPGSGVMLHFIAPSGIQYTYGSGTLVSGNELNGTYTIQIPISTFAERGTWLVHYVYLTDYNDNYRYYYESELRGAGYNTELIVGPIHSTPGEINDYIQGLPDSSFKPPAHARRTAFENKFEEVQSLIDAGNYAAAIDKLNNDIRPKMDGCLGGNPANDWITDCAAQSYLDELINGLIEYLESLL